MMPESSEPELFEGSNAMLKPVFSSFKEYEEWVEQFRRKVRQDIAELEAKSPGAAKEKEKV